MKFRDYDNYEIYEDGRIWSYKRKKFLKPCTMKDGYQLVWLYDNYGKRKGYLLHRVIYESVTRESIPEGMQCNHINECKSDNSFFNINLLTPKENLNWGTRNERSRKAISKAMKNNQKLSKSLTNNPKRSKAVGAFKYGKLVMTFPSTSECGRNGFCQCIVSMCCRNCYMREGNNIYKGYEWRYIYKKKETLK